MDTQNKRSTVSLKIVNDIVHGIITLPIYIQQIIDTEQFQRMRDISQLGFCKFVYPSAGYSRFEHAIGTFHLASLLIKQLKDQEKNEDLDIKITDEDRKCVEIAALCHDLGHGPFSNFWEHTFPRPRLKTYDRDMKHREYLSVEIFNDLVVKNKIDGLNEDMIKRIGRIIKGTLNKSDDPKKRFLFEIIANKESGLDVAKFDYLCRDTIYFGWSNKNKIQEIKRITSFFRLIKVDEEWRLAMRDKELFNIYDIFYYRHMLHRYGYQHKTVIAIDTMMKDALNDELDNNPLSLIDLIIYVNGKEVENAFEPDLNKLLRNNENDRNKMDYPVKLIELKRILEDKKKKNEEKKDDKEELQNIIVKMLYSKELISKCREYHIWNMLENCKKQLVQDIANRKLYKLFYKFRIKMRNPDENLFKQDIIHDLEKLFKDYLTKVIPINPNETPEISVKISIATSKFSLTSEKENPIYKIPFYKKENISTSQYFNITNNLPPSLVKFTNKEFIVLIFANKIIKTQQHGHIIKTYEAIRYDKKYDEFFRALLERNEDDSNKRMERQAMVEDCLSDIFDQFYKSRINEEMKAVRQEFCNDISGIIRSDYSSLRILSRSPVIETMEEEPIAPVMIPEDTIHQEAWIGEIIELQKKYKFRESKY